MNDSNPSFKGLIILIVDSDLDSRAILQALFDMLQVETVIVPTVHEALSVLQSIIPDVIISELVLPDADGSHLMRRVLYLEDEFNYRIPAIALTVHARKQDCQYALQSGFRRHIAKPFDFETLIATIADFIDEI